MLRSEFSSNFSFIESPHVSWCTLHSQVVISNEVEKRNLRTQNEFVGGVRACVWHKDRKKIISSPIYTWGARKKTHNNQEWKERKRMRWRASIISFDEITLQKSWIPNTEMYIRMRKTLHENNKLFIMFSQRVYDETGCRWPVSPSLLHLLTRFSLGFYWD